MTTSPERGVEETHNTREWIEEIEHQAKQHIAKLLGYLQQIHDSGQYRCAEIELEKVLENVELLTKTLHQELQKALRCGKDMGDGSICGCKLDCHLHDWRQREQIQIARHDWLREEIVKLEGMKVTPEHNSECLNNEVPEYCDCDNWTKHNKALQTIIDRYLSELDQPNK